MATTSTLTATNSFSNTPQAQGDLFTTTGLTEDSLTIVTLDVMSNDLGGNAKTLWSLDNGIEDEGSATSADLLTQDTARAEAISTDRSANGAKIWITSDGKVGYDAGCLSATFKDQLQHLGAGQYLEDTFTYAIRLGNGTLSWTTATVRIYGVNDAAVIGGATTGSVTEDVAVAANHIATSGALTITDVDTGQDHFQAQASTAGSNGYGVFTLDSAGHWTYSADNTQTAIQQLGATGTLTDSFTAVSADGTTKVVTVTIHGTNDVAVIGGATTGSATEDVAVVADHIGTSGALTITDVDTGEAHFQAQASTAGSNGYGVFTLDAAGAWTYSADNTQTAIQELGAGETVTDSFTALAADGTSQVVTVTITGTNDAPTITLVGADSDHAEVDETNAALTAAGALTVGDVDHNDSVAVSVDSLSVGGTGSTGVSNADLKAMLTIGNDGAWSFDSGSEAFNNLATGETLVLTYTVSASDGDASATHDVTITITGTNDAAVLSADTSNLTETDSTADISASGQLTISDVDSAETFVAQSGVAGNYGQFSIDAAGAWSYTADSAHNEFVDGTTYTDTFSVASADGTLTSVTVNILGTNDAAVLSADTSNLTETDSAADISTSGQLTISDVDSPETFVAQSGVAGNYGQFSIDAAGAWSYTADSAHNEFVDGTTYTDTFSVASADGTTTSVTVNILGTNDAAVLSADTSNLTETDSAADISASGQLTISDVDSAETFVAQSGVAGNYGQFSIDAAGAWSYTADSAHNEFVDGTTYTDTFSVASADGTLTSVTVNILGTNDAAVLSADTSNLTETDSAADISTSGQLTISDVDSAETFVAQSNVAGAYGQFSIDAAGAWSYTADSAHNEFVDGTTYTDTFSVASADGTLTSVTVNILGTNDAADLSADTSNLTETDSATDISTSGQLTISDVDSAETFVAQSNVAGNYGQFSIDAAGAWTYTADSAHNEFVDGTTYTDTFSVASADGTTTSVTVNILGTNDAAVLSADTSNLTETDSAADISTSGQLTISDVDSPETFVTQSNVAGAYGQFSIDAAGAWSYTADSAHNEFVDGTTYTDTFSVASADGTTTSVTVNILGTNDAPTITEGTSDLSPTGLEDSLITGAVHATDLDDGDTLTFSVVNTGTGAPAHGSVSIDANTGAYSYTPDADYNGSDSFTVTVTDSHNATDTVVVNVGVTAVNDAPVIDALTSDLSPSGDEDTTIAGTIVATDVDGDTLTYSAPAKGDPGGPTHGSVSFDADGGYVYTPDADYNGSDSFTVTVSDGNSGTDTVVVNVTVDPVNDAPTLGSVASGSVSEVDQSSSTTSGGLTGALVGGDVDAGTTLTYGIQGGTVASGVSTLVGSYGTLSVNTLTGVYSYTPNSAAVEGLDSGENPTDSFTVTVSDGTATTTTSYAVNLHGADDAPTLAAVTDGSIAEVANSSATTTSGLAGTLVGSDVDVETLSYGIQGGTVASGMSTLAGTYGTLSVNTSTGAYSYTPNAAAVEGLSDGQHVSDAFTFTVSDGDAPLGTTAWHVNLTGAADGDPNDFDNLATASSQVIMSSGANGAGTVVGSAFNDTLMGGQGNDLIYGGAGDDTIYGYAPGVLTQQADADTIYGGSGADHIYGNQADDTIFGGSGNDFIWGNTGNDTLTGGQGADVFMYDATGDQTDRITDFSHAEGDRIDLSAIDANTALGGDQAFTLFATDFNGVKANQITFHYDNATNITHVMADVDGNVATIDFHLDLSGNVSLSAGDFIL